MNESSSAVEFGTLARLARHKAWRAPPHDAARPISSQDQNVTDETGREPAQTPAAVSASASLLLSPSQGSNSDPEGDRRSRHRSLGVTAKCRLRRIPSGFGVLPPALMKQMLAQKHIEGRDWETAAQDHRPENSPIGI